MKTKLGNRNVAGLAPNSEIWDSTVSGFGARRQRSEAISFVLMFRTGDGVQRRMTIGRFGSPWTPETARREAQRLLGSVASGGDPSRHKQEARTAMTITELCDAYILDVEAGRLLTRHRQTKKASTIAVDRMRIERHVKPLLGTRRAKDITGDDVEEFMHAVAQGATVELAKKVRYTRTTGGRGTATRTVGMLGAIFTYAIKQRVRPDNPVRGVVRFADGKRDRRLTDPEFAALGRGMVAAATEIWPTPLAAAKFLAVTGWRRGEMINLTWKDVDLERRTAVLPDTKTGRSIRPLSKIACDLMLSVPRDGDFVFPSLRADKPLRAFANLFTKLIRISGLPSEITPHTLRHSVASVASDLGFSEATIAGLLGHVGNTMTARYTHAADELLLRAADAVAERITAAMQV